MSTHRYWVSDDKFLSFEDFIDIEVIRKTLINMEVKFNSESNGMYEAPILEYLDCDSEGVLCQSLPGTGESWNDGGII